MWAKRDRGEEKLRSEQLQGAALVLLKLHFLPWRQPGTWLENLCEGGTVDCAWGSRSYKGAGFSEVRRCCPHDGRMPCKEGWTRRWDTRVGLDSYRLFLLASVSLFVKQARSTISKGLLGSASLRVCLPCHFNVW